MKPQSPGWYPDPHNSANERWWNGIGWSDDDVRPKASATSPDSTPAQAQVTPPPAPAQPADTAEQAASAFGYAPTTAQPAQSPYGAARSASAAPYAAGTQQPGAGRADRSAMGWPQIIAIVGIACGVAALFVGAFLGIVGIGVGVVARNNGARSLGIAASVAGAAGFFFGGVIRAFLHLHTG